MLKSEYKVILSIYIYYTSGKYGFMGNVLTVKGYIFTLIKINSVEQLFHSFKYIALHFLPLV